MNAGNWGRLGYDGYMTNSPAPDAAPPTLLLVDEVAARLRLSEHSVRRLIRQGRLGAVRLGGNRVGLRVNEAELRRFIAEASTTGSPA